MKTFNDYVNEYGRQIRKGDISEAYRRLMHFMLDLKAHFKKKHPDCYVPGSLYNGYMDMTYFSFIPPFLKSKKLKIAVVFLHEEIRYEVWLSGLNKQIQLKYWRLFKERYHGEYQIPESIMGEDSIAEHVLIENPDFDNLRSLTDEIEKGTLKFIEDMKSFLSE